MRGYAVHLLFHLLAMAAGAGCGAAVALWWYGGEPTGLWLALGALMIGIIVLVLEWLYISANQPEPPAPPQQTYPPRTYPPQSRPRMQAPQRPRTRPDLEPVAAPSETLLQPAPESTSVDQETKTSATDALRSLGTADRPTHQS
ncbi:hypothetical protein [Saccharopolyspora sp. NPDC002686]|uniref:hypothetical protein n=1 Tax=Saccharopolyspora sp. NPDC002686 TaxID=3154541 RepID=UPI003321FC02